MDKYNVKFGCRRSWLNLGLLFTAFFLANANAYAFCAGTLIKEIKALANKPEVIEAVKASNARQLGKERIMELDERWIKLKGRLPEADQIMNSKVSALLTAAMNKQSYFKEAILTGNQGETVAMNMVTTDYWQGDEEKFTAIFDTNLPSRKPDSHISRARWDDSTKAMIAQVSVPVYDGDYMIGTLTVGVDLKRVPHPNH
ncbi:MAG: hypothetical protein U1D41_02665 [Nitrosomonas sp.]|jgi:hypothetical protein|uniref:Cache domain-containing protein n=1 Tax=Limnobacter profundi TaxID=2732163 RepID=A0ABX6NAR5_9BURK|nr:MULTISPECIES: hypothetical protein [Betaproteobacteria]MDP3271260.1 hypothetical protein [Limnobacter sp.]MDZ4105061.1 hypothetical protein [Nitrosomonas sp.]QJR30995.1 hypothetical protein HKT17_15445 [Limnobacter sp. SAORIC-580]RZO93622.1 MAG: hypothetical protein EVA59_04625 [Limnobacter sp.]